MPYASIANLPEHAKALPEEAQRVFLSAVNAALASDPDDAKAMQAAWSAVESAGFAKNDAGAWVKKQAESTATKRNTVHVDAQGNVEIFVPVTKRDDAKQRVFGIAMTATDEHGNEVTDWQGDVISPEDLEDAAYDYVANAGSSGAYHEPSEPGFVADAGHVIESTVLTLAKRQAYGLPPGPAIWCVGIQLTRPDVFKRYQSGELKQFSIRGSAVREAIQ